LAIPALTIGGSLLAVGLFTQLAVTGFGVSGARLAPEWSRLNPMKKATEAWSNNFRSTTEAAMLLPVFLILLWVVVSAHFTEFMALPRLSLPSALYRVGDALVSLLYRSGAVLLLWGAIDLFRQKRRYMTELKMTKQEIRDEWKQNEGNPEVKMRLRRIRRDLLRRRMMSEVPTATAVIVNPTHYAVAIKYDVTSMPAPKVVAKGKNYLALRIRQKAIDNQVPVIENKPLAQALYKQCEVGHEIPANLYRAAAEVLAYVYRLMKGNNRKGF
jgi:flagellar biosynthesis protein FlhB